MSTDIHIVAPSAQESPAEEYWLQLLHGFEEGIAEQYVMTNVSQDGSVIFAIDTYDSSYVNMRMPVGRITRDGVLTFGDYGVWSPYWVVAVEDGLAFTALDGDYAHSAIFMLDKFNRLLWAKQWAGGAEYTTGLIYGGDVLWGYGIATASDEGLVSKINATNGVVQSSWVFSHATFGVRISGVRIVNGIAYIAYIVERGGYNNNSHGILAMTTAGVKLWDRTYTLTAGWTYIGYNIVFLDGHLYVDGGRWNPFPYRDAHIMKISAATGDLVWARRLVTTPSAVSSFSAGIESKDGQPYISVAYVDDSEAGFSAVIKITPDGDAEWQQALSRPSDPAGFVGTYFQIAATQSEGLSVNGMDYDSSGVYLPFLGHLPIRPDGPMTFGDYVWEDHPLDYPFVDITADFTVTADYVTLTPAAYVLEDFAVPAYSPGIDHREVS